MQPLREAKTHLGTGEQSDSRTRASCRPRLWRVVPKLKTNNQNYNSSSNIRAARSDVGKDK